MKQQNTKAGPIVLTPEEWERAKPVVQAIR